MRYLLIATLSAAFIGIVLASGLAMAEEALDPAPMSWRGLQMGGEQVFEGDFTIDYETSVFLADGAPKSDAVWLAGWKEHPGDNGGFLRRYHIRFVGRRTAAPGRFGSLGAYKSEVLITRLVSARVLIGN